MKILVFISLLLIVLSSCPYDGGRIYDAFSGKDRMPPEMQSFSLVDNSYMKIVYDEDVTVIDARLDDIPLRGNPIIGHRKTDFLFIDLTSMCSFNFAPEEDASPFDFRRLDGIAIHKGRYLLYCNDREYSFPICEKRRPLKRLSK